MDPTQIALRFIVAFIFAVVFGLERQRSHKPVGFGTFVFVTIGATGLAIVSVELGTETPLSILGSVVTGIGFLGAGALIKSGDRTHGFTTATSIWAFSILGLLIGLGEFWMAGVMYGLIWLVILVDTYLEKKGIGSYQRKLVIKTNRLIPQKELKNLLAQNLNKYKVMSVEIEKETPVMIFTYLIQSKKNDINKLPNILYQMDWVHSCKVE
ncbi:MAG TPA: MgtC/SapB family protein [Candidatus Nanoarchaeia archaeon]|nr:MgtC/SapB family protein [Candidatus Nanoarchaeia archaeon]